MILSVIQETFRSFIWPEVIYLYIAREQILVMDTYFQHLLNIIKTPNDLQMPVKKATDHWEVD